PRDRVPPARRGAADPVSGAAGDEHAGAVVATVLRAGGVRADAVAVDAVAPAAGDLDSVPVEQVDDQPANDAAGMVDQPQSVGPRAGTLAAQHDERPAVLTGAELRPPVDYHLLRDVRQRRGERDRPEVADVERAVVVAVREVRAGRRDGEADGIGAGVGVRLDDRGAERTGTAIAGVHDLERRW